MGSPVVPLNKMNFKFLLAVFVVAVALMPTAHSQLPNRLRQAPDPRIPGSLTSLDLEQLVSLTDLSNRGRMTPSRLKELKERLAAKCRRGTCPKTKTSTGCQAGWSAFNGKCYKSFSEEKTWDEAEDQCVNEHANLVSLHSEEEHQFVVGLNGGFPWLGGRRDPGNRDNFVWSDGTPWDYSNWASGQPDGIRNEVLFNTVEDCAHIWDVNQWNTVNGLWNDQPCSREKTFVCKKGPSDSVVETKPGLILSGGAPIDIAGTAVEVFVPSSGQHCRLPSLPGGRRQDHSINENIVCGGSPYNSDPNYTGHDETRSSCVTLARSGTWVETTRLLEQRYRHSSWASPSGLILLGGRGSKRTTEKIEEDGTSSYSFELKYDLE